jgi:ribosomal protein L3 glutamine methyltransferase
VRLGARRFRAARLAFGHGTRNARDEAAYLALHALNLAPDAAAGAFDRRVDPRDARRVLSLFERRIRSRKPAAYLMREAWLGDFRFHVDERVVVPRSHIAGLLRENLAPWIPNRRAIKSTLDLCTGSGCLAVLLAHSFPLTRIDAADSSSEALAVARINVQRYRLSRRIRLVKSDMFSALRGKRYDLIVSNPPYVPTGELSRLQREVQREPRLALDGGADGLAVLRRVVAGAPARLTAGGTLLMEMHESHLETLPALCLAAGFASAEARRDLAGLPRLTLARMAASAPAA